MVVMVGMVVGMVRMGVGMYVMVEVMRGWG
jgi:hypothetical protein